MTSRRQFVQTQSFGRLSSLMLAVPSVARNPSDLMGIIINNDNRATIQMRDRIVKAETKKASAQVAESIAFLSESYSPGYTLPVHKHLQEDELIFLRKGSGLFTLGDNQYQLKEGAVIFVAKGVWHGLENNGNVNVKMLFRYAAWGFKDIFTGVGMSIISSS